MGKRIVLILAHFFMILLLTILTQIGGFIYILTLLLVKKKSTRIRWKQLLVFGLLYTSATFIIVPPLARSFGREPIKDVQGIVAHSFFYKLANRNYVKPELNMVLENTLEDFQQKYPDIKLVYLDANFPFIDGFPLLPHLSHNDGKKIDVTFIYKDNLRNVTNQKPSVSGYGVYEKPKRTEVNQPKMCKIKGYWKYDFPRYLALGTVNNALSISEKETRSLSLSFLKQEDVSKLFIEPHLKERLKLDHPKVRFHGCRAVRHDDHIHVQVY